MVMIHVVNNGDAYDAVLQHVLANIRAALHNGVSPTQGPITKEQELELASAAALFEH